MTHVVPCLQMLSEDSSNRVDSGNAFEGNPPSPSSLDSRQSPEISWTESSHHGSASQGHEVAEEGERVTKKRAPRTRESGAMQTSSLCSLFVTPVG